MAQRGPAKMFSFLFHLIKAALFAVHQGIRTQAQRSGDAMHAGKDIVQTEGGENQLRDGARGSLFNVGWSDGADVAVGLGQDQVGVDGFNLCAVNLVERFTRMDPPANFGVDFAAGKASGVRECGLAQDWEDRGPSEWLSHSWDLPTRVSLRSRRQHFRAAGQRGDDAYGSILEEHSESPLVQSVSPFCGGYYVKRKPPAYAP